MPKSIRRQAGIQSGDQFEFSVSGRVITIAPKLTPNQREDEREIRDPKVRAIIRKSHQDFVAGKSRPIEELFAERAAKSAKPPPASVTPPSTFVVRATSHYDRLSNKLHKADRDFDGTEKGAAAILSVDPYNRTRRHDIKKLEGVPPGDGQYRPAVALPL